MNLFNVLTQADWTRAVRFWLLVATAVAVCESAYLFRGALKARFGREDNRA